MAKKKIQAAEIIIKTTDGGSFKYTGKEAEKLGKKLEKTGRQAQNTDRKMKGVTQQSSNATKEFSKMATMQGGIVQAYATIAAQVFALSAAFQFLKDAMETRNLIEGQLAFGAVTGTAYKTLTNQVQAATGGMLQFKEAAQAVAIGTAGGLSAGQLERLGAAAKNTSLALGRDLTDSFNRLVRGVTKAEPELLDELGIILRLEPALKTYAAELGKPVAQLSQFEKSQAIANEVLTQAEQKFGMMSLLMDDSAFALQQFQKTFDDLMNTLKKGVGDFAGKVLPFFTDNIMALVGALTLVLAPVLKSLLPDFAAMSAAKTAQADAHIRKMEEEKIAMQAYQAKQKELANTQNKQRLVAAPELDAQASKLGIKGGIRGKARMIAHYEKQTTQLIKGEITKRTGALAEAEPREVAILKKKYKNMEAATASTTSKIKAYFSGITNRVAVETARMKGIWAATMAGMARMTAAFTRTVNKLMRAMGWAGVILMIYEGIKALRQWIRGVDEARQKEKEYFDEVSSRYADIAIEMGKMEQARQRGFVAGDQLISQIGSSLKNLDIQRFTKEWNDLMATKPDAFDTEQLEAWKKSVESMKEAWKAQVQVMGEETFGASQHISSYTDMLDSQTMITEEAEKATRKYTNSLIDMGDFIDGAAERAKELKKAILEVTQAMGSEKYGNLIDLGMEDYLGHKAMGVPLWENKDARDLTHEQLDKDMADAQLRMDASKKAEMDMKIKWNRMYRDDYQQRRRQIDMSTLTDEMFDEQATGLEKSLFGYYTNFGGGVAEYRQEIMKFANQQNDILDEMDNLLKKKTHMEGQEDSDKAADEALTRVKNMFALQEDISHHMTRVNEIKRDTIKLDGKLYAHNNLETQNHKQNMKVMEGALDLYNKKNALREIEQAATIRDLDLEQMAWDKTNMTVEEYLTKYQEADRANYEKWVRSKEDVALSKLKYELTRSQVYEQKVLNTLAWEAKEQKYAEQKITKQLAIDAANNAIATEKAVGYAQERAALAEKNAIEGRKADQILTKAVNAEKALTDYTKERWAIMYDENGYIKGMEKVEHNLEKAAELESKRLGFIQDYLKALKEISRELYKQSGQAQVDDILSATSKGETEAGSRFGKKGFLSQRWGAWGSAFGNNDYREKRGQMGYETDAEMIAGESAKMKEAWRTSAVASHFEGKENVTAQQIQDFKATLTMSEAQIKSIEDAAADLPKKLYDATMAAKNFNIELELAESIESTIENGFVSMFQALVDGTQSLEDAMKSLMKQVLADLAAAYLKAAALKFMMTMGIGAPSAPAPAGRYGGVMSKSGRSYGYGGIAHGPNSGYQATLHGTEAVVPLGNDRSIPVELSGGGGGNIVNVSISMNGQGQAQSQVSGDGLQGLGRSVGNLVQAHLQQEMRPGGILNPQGSRGRT